MQLLAEPKRKRGRPRLGEGPKFTKRWQPVNWQPEYEEIVRLSCTGMSNKELALRYKFHPVHIVNILKTDQARSIKATTVQNIRELSETKTEIRMMNLVERSLQIHERVLNDDDLLESHPFAVFDRADSFLSRIGKLKADSEKNTTNNTINAQNVVFISKEAEDRLTKGVEDLKHIGMLPSITK
jgi:hypothetical protein